MTKATAASDLDLLLIQEEVNMKHAMCEDKRKTEKEVKMIRAEVKAKKKKTTTTKDDST